MNHPVTTFSLLLTFIQAGFSAWAQNPLSQQVQTEFGIGISTPFLYSGAELLQSQSIREAGLSYFQDTEGRRNEVGDYGNLIGWSLAVAYYIPVTKVDGLMLGSAFRTSLTGSQPQTGGYEEGYFFNTLSLGLAAKYYPFARHNAFVKLDAGMASVFTKNRFMNAAQEQAFFHQFGIGTNASVALGLSMLPFQNKKKSVDLQIIYQINSTRVEVNGLGNDTWVYSAITLMAAINF